MILRILIPLVVLLMLPAWGIDRLWWHRHVKGWKRWLVYTPSATLSLLLILTAANESYSMAADHWKGQLLSVTLTFLVPQALLALLLGLGQLAKRRAPRISHAINIAAVITSLLGLAAMTYGMTGGYRHLVVKHYTYTDRRIPPAFNGYRIVHSPLTLDERGVWRMDYEDMDRKLKEHHIHVAVFCSPHNPCGRVWERWEIEKAMEVYKANDCVVISDEIWSDLTLGNHQHIPTQSVSEDARNGTVAFYAPSKTFNLAGLVGSYHIIYNPTLRDRIVAKSSKCHYNDMNVLSMHALIGAYRPEGHEWLDELKAVLTGNVDYAYDYITKHFQGVSLAKPEGTYMLLLDCEQWCERHGLSLPELEKRGWDVGVAWQDGSMFQAPYSIRVNLALPLSRVKEAMRRLDQYVFNA